MALVCVPLGCFDLHECGNDTNQCCVDSKRQSQRGSFFLNTHKHVYHSLKREGERLPKMIITWCIYMPDFPTPPTHSRLTTTYVSSSHHATSTPSCTPPVPSLSRPAFSHNMASSLILCRILEREGEAPLNTT